MPNTMQKNAKVRRLSRGAGPACGAGIAGFPMAAEAAMMV
jgi:hypothetical protein